MKKLLRSYKVDSDIIYLLKPLTDKYGINVSAYVGSALLELLIQLQSVDQLASAYPDGLPAMIVREHMEQRLKRTTADLKACLDESVSFLPKSESLV